MSIIIIMKLRKNTYVLARHLALHGPMKGVCGHICASAPLLANYHGAGASSRINTPLGVSLSELKHKMVAFLAPSRA